MRAPLLETCDTRYLLADGGVSTMLRRMTGDSSLRTETLNLTHPETVLEMHSQFVDAGADCITTNTFAANASHLHNLSPAECDRACSEGVRLARQAAGPDRWVLGSVGPWYATDDGWKEAFGAQVRCLADAGVDAILIETLTTLEAAHALAKIATANDSGLPVIISFAFQKAGPDKFILPGDEAGLEMVSSALASVGAQAYGVNCGKGLDAFDYSALISALKEASGKPIIARPSAGDPIGEDEGFINYPDTPEYMAEAVWGMVRAGANIVGGCCGVTPLHTASFRRELDMLG